MLDEKLNRKVFSQRRDKYASQYGLLCFSSKWTNPVMWSHYAENHKGMALGFDVPDNDLVKIEYSSSRLKILNNDYNFDKILKLKFNHWRYENEFRVKINLNGKDVEKLHGMSFVKFSPNLKLKEIILGPRYEQSLSFNKNEHSIIDSEVEVITSRLSFKEFRIYRQRRESLQKRL